MLNLKSSDHPKIQKGESWRPLRKAWIKWYGLEFYGVLITGLKSFQWALCWRTHLPRTHLCGEPSPSTTGQAAALSPLFEALTQSWVRQQNAARRHSCHSWSGCRANSSDVAANWPCVRCTAAQVSCKGRPCTIPLYSALPDYFPLDATGYSKQKLCKQFRLRW